MEIFDAVSMFEGQNSYIFHPTVAAMDGEMLLNDPIDARENAESEWSLLTAFSSFTEPAL